VSVAGNVAITQLVDKPNVGVHVRLPKSIFVNQEGVSGDRSSRQIIKHIEASGAARSLVTTFRQS